MPAAPYLLHVNSRPTQVSDSTWEDWYTTEHIPDLFNAKSCVRDTFYVEIPWSSNPNPDNPRKYLALYQTDVLARSPVAEPMTNSFDSSKNS